MLMKSGREGEKEVFDRIRLEKIVLDLKKITINNGDMMDLEITR